MTDYFPRAIDEALGSWADAPERKPLVLRGARQTGKSSSIRELGRQFELFVELNLERYDDRELVASSRSAEELLLALQAKLDLERFPARTLLFLDEIQEAPQAIRWLRFLYRDHPELHVIAAGSLLEVRLDDKGFSFPVGRVTFRTLHPFTFLEFLGALGKDVLAERLRDRLGASKASIPAIHALALRQFRDYLLVGGMPEAVATWVRDGNPVLVRRIHRDLLQAFAEDIHKYRGVRDPAYLEAAFASLPDHYGLRFRYERFAPGYRSERMKTALGKLEAALLITRVLPTSSLTVPLRAKPRSAPKLLPLDIGIALESMGVPFEAIRSQPIEKILDGRAAEIVAGQLLRSESLDQPLRFWVRESARSNAEVDYLLAAGGEPVPVEVKAGASGRLRSLHQFLIRSGRPLGVRLHPAPFADERHRIRVQGVDLDYRLLSIPLYLTELLGGVLRDLPR